MGSLVPGWDADSQGVAPKDMEDRDEFEEEPQGYFAKLRQKQLARRSHDLPHSSTMPVPVAEHPPLQRVSAPYASSNSPPSYGRMSSLSSGSPPIACSRVGPAPNFASRSVPKHGPVMDWAEELSTLKGKAPSKPLPKEEKAPLVGSKSAGWWRSLDSGALNARPDVVEDPHARSGASFIPQFNAAKIAAEVHQDQGT